MSWRHAALISALFHLGVILLIIFGLPFFSSKKSSLIAPLSIDVVEIGEKAKAPKPKPVPKPESQEKPKPESQPKPAPESKPESQPEPKPQPEPEPEKKQDLLPAPKEEPKKEEAVIPEKPKKEPVKPKQESKKSKKSLEKKKKEEKKKKSEDRFNSILKNLEKMKSSTSEDEKKDDKEETEEETAQAGDFGEKITMSEMDALKRQLADCWNIPAGAKDAQDLSIEVEILVNNDATVRDVKIVDMARYASDPFFRAAADSARRAVLSPQCSPLKLPLGKYEQWKKIIFTFNPKDML